MAKSENKTKKGGSLASLGSNEVVGLKEINKSFRVGDQNVWVLKNINVSIQKGEFVIIFGPSGSGKSTMLHVMLGLEPPDTGHSSLMGLDLYSNKVDEDSKSRFRKQYVGMIYQQPNWIKSLNVIDNVAFPLVLQGQEVAYAQKQALQYLETVGMQEWAEYRPSELSSGQQQKVSLARALVNNPQLLVADEPTGNLDFQSSDDLMNLFRKLVDEGKTVVMVTHELSNLAFADRILRFMDGRIVGELQAKNMESEEIEKRILDWDRDNAKNIKSGEPEEQAPPILKQMGEGETRAERWKLRLYGLLSYFTRAVLMFGLIVIHIFFQLLLRLVSLPLLVKLLPDNIPVSVRQRMLKIERFIEPMEFGSMSKFYVVDLSIRNMFAKKARTLVTIGGIAIGISFIVFLISIGFGAEQLVINRVARLEELRQFEAIPAVNTQVKITDSTISRFKQLDKVNDVLPLIGVAGRIDYNNSAADVVVYGAQSIYLEQSAIRPVTGELYENDNLTNAAVSALQQQEEESEVVEDVEVSQEEVTQEIVRQIEEDGLTEETVGTEKIVLSSRNDREAVVNTVFLQVLGIETDRAVGQEFGVEFVVTGNLTDDGNKLESESVNYKIVGVIDEGQTPLLYVPVTDVREIGLDKYSSIKVAVEGEDDLNSVRRQVELAGYRTTSVFDTVVQIEALFENFRILLIFVGAIALAVASLGMFNTLTVSLLERTREVGLMKAIGMKASEVRDLFISESISMGFLGGIMGLVIGFLVGKLLSLILTIIAISRGFEAIDVTYLPTSFLFTILVISGFVGMLTGFYPAMRATRISALNALRYE